MIYDRTTKRSKICPLCPLCPYACSHRYAIACALHALTERRVYRQTIGREQDDLYLWWEYGWILCVTLNLKKLKWFMSAKAFFIVWVYRICIKMLWELVRLGTILPFIAVYARCVYLEYHYNVLCRPNWLLTITFEQTS